LNKQTKCETLAQKAIAGGFTGEQVDGNDILALRQVIGEAITKARQGKGPSLIEAISYRLSHHTTADDATRYQPEAEVKEARNKEPLIRFKQFLFDQKILTEELEQEIQKSCTEEVNAEVDKFLHMPKPQVTSAFDYHFATFPDYLIEQRATAIEEEENNALS